MRVVFCERAHIAPVRSHGADMPIEIEYKQPPWRRIGLKTCAALPPPRPKCQARKDDHTAGYKGKRHEHRYVKSSHKLARTFWFMSITFFDTAL